MKFSDDLLKSVSSILEAKPRVSFDGDKATVHSKNGTPMKSFSKKDLGNDFRKQADNFLSQNYKKLNAESVIIEELEEAKQLELPGMEKKPKQLELPFGKKDDKKKEVKEAEDVNTSNAAKATMHDCANHVRHEEYGLGQTIPTMHTLEEDEDGNGYVTHYDVMFQGEDGPFIMEDVWVEDLEIISEKHHGHPKGKKKMSEDVEAIEEKKGHKKDKGDMDGDGIDEPDDKEYMDNKDKAIKAAMSKKKSESPIKKVQEAKKHVDEKKSSDCGEGEYFCKDAQKCKPIPEGMKLDGEQLVKEENIEEAPKYIPGFMGADGKPTSKPTQKDYDSNKEYQHMKRKLGDRIPGPPAKKINKEHLDSISAALQEISNKTLHSYISKASDPKNKKGVYQQAKKSEYKEKQYREPGDDGGDVESKRAVNREKGIRTAVSKLSMSGQKSGARKADKNPRPASQTNESNELEEISRKTLHKYVTSARSDRDERTSDAHHLYHHSDGNEGDTADRFGGMDYANAGRTRDKRGEGITRAANRMADSKYGKAKPGQKTKLSKALRKESTEIQEISKATLNDYQDRRRHDKDVMNSRAAEKHQRAMDHGQGNYISGTEKGKEKAKAIKDIKSDAAYHGEKVNAKKAFKKIVKQRGKQNYYDHQQHKMGKNIDRAFNRLASDTYGKAKPGQKTKLASDVKKEKIRPASHSMYNKPKMIQPKFEKRRINKESNQYTDDLADRIRSHENKKERKKAEKAFTAGDYEKATGHIGGTYREK